MTNTVKVPLTKWQLTTIQACLAHMLATGQFHKIPGEIPAVQGLHDMLKLLNTVRE